MSELRRGPVVFGDILRSVSTTTDNLFIYTIYSLLWWVGIAVIISAPAATISLFRVTDPRSVLDDNRPAFRDVGKLISSVFRRSWILTILFAPVAFVAIVNLAIYAGDQSRLSILVPFWIATLLILLLVGTASASVVGLQNAGWKDAIISAGVAITRRPLAAVVNFGAGILIIMIGAVLVVPLFLIVPAMICAIVNRYVLRSLDLAVPEPLQPSPERLAEDLAKQASRRFGP
jgi:hypothetical protein